MALTAAASIPAAANGRSTASRWALAVVVMVAALAAAAPASAQTDEGGDTQVVLTGRAEVRAGERADTVAILDGDAVIAGFVDGAVVALNGDVRVATGGVVDEAAVAMNGTVFVEAGARVGGDVVSSEDPQVAPGATVEGDVETVRFSFRALGILFWIGWWVAVTVSALVLGLLLLALLPRALDAALAVARTAVGPAIALGVAIAVGLPIASVLVMFTLVGIPLGLLGLFSLALVFALGYITGALAVGRLMVKEPASRFLAFVVGLLVLRVLGLIPFIGGLVTFAASAYGLGALVIAGWRAARTGPAPVTPEPVVA